MPQFETFQATVEGMETHKSGLWDFTFSLDKPINFVAGQYVSVYFPNMKPAPFSIASSPAETNTLQLGVEVVGRTTTAMSQLSPGDVVEMRGPFGKFVMERQNKVCFLAGGIGITPFASMMRYLRDTGEQRLATLFYSCKDRHQFVWFDELAAMHSRRKNLQTIFTLTKEVPEDWEYEKGRINPDMIKKYLPDYKEYTFYTCGPPGLIDAMFAMLSEMGVPEQQLKREAWH